MVCAGGQRTRGFLHGTFPRSAYYLHAVSAFLSLFFLAIILGQGVHNEFWTS